MKPERNKMKKYKCPKCGEKLENSKQASLHNKKTEHIGNYNIYPKPLEQEYPILFFKCEKCTNLWIPQIRFNISQERFYVSAYCPICCRYDPLNELIVKYVNLEFFKQIKSLPKNRK